MVLVVASYLISVILEWPFFHFGLLKTARNISTSFRASLLAQTVSYALLIPFYLLASGFSLFTNAQLTKDRDFVVRKDAAVYFISSDLQAVYRLALDGSSPQRVVECKVSNSDARLYVCRSPDAQSWDLWVLDEPEYNHSKKSERLLIRDFALHAAANWRTERSYGEERTWFNFGPASDLRATSQTNWTVRTGFWPVKGLSAENPQTRRSIHLCVEMPFLAWPSRNATVLPGDQVVYQLGDQIVLLDLNSRKLAFLALGQGPVVVLQSQ